MHFAPRGVLPSRQSGTTGVVALVLATAFCLSGCRPNDLGSRCELARPVCVANCDDPDNWEIVLEAYDPEDHAKDYIATGVVDCEHFTCVASAGNEGRSYCTRPCLEDDQCRGGEVPELICRELILDDAFIGDLCEQLGPEGCEEVFGAVRRSSYCALPLPADE